MVGLKLFGLSDGLLNLRQRPFLLSVRFWEIWSTFVNLFFVERARQSVKHDHKASLNLLRKWRTYIEPYDTAGKVERQNGDA